MSLEARIELLTAAVTGLTAVIGALQAPGPVTQPEIPHREYTASEIVNMALGHIGEVADAAQEMGDAVQIVPNADTVAVQTGTSAGAATVADVAPLDYAKDVKPITIQLSKEKGREITIGVLSRFGVKSAQDLDAAQWAEYIAHCGKVLAGGEV
jgi:hypothetical protein